MLIFKFFLVPLKQTTQFLLSLSLPTKQKRIIPTTPDEFGDLTRALMSILESEEKKRKELELKAIQKTQEYDKNIKDLQRFDKTMINREITMIRLKQQLKVLQEKLGITETNTQPLTRYVTANSEAIAQEDFKKAFLNVLEDLQRNKEKIEQEKITDEAVLTSIGDGMITTDKDGKVTIINQSAQILLENNEDDALSKQIEDVIPIFYSNDKPIPKPDNPVYVALLTGHKVTSSTADIIYFAKKSGTKFPTTITVSPIKRRDPNSGITSIIGSIMIFRDTTKEHEIDRMKTEFISLASHQLRTPLSAIKWFSEMLLDGDAGELSPEQKKLMTSVYQSNKRMIALVNSILNISRIESGRIIIDPQPTNLLDLINEVMIELKIKMDQKEQTFVSSIHETLPLISVDPKLIREVYVVLLSNAIKYTPNKGEITVFLSRKGDQIVSQISDTGYGIPKKEQANIFQKFYRGSNITNVIPDGNGLGLYLAKTIVLSSRGSIWFESKEGKGTTFWFSLPMTGTPAKTGQATIDSEIKV